MTILTNTTHEYKSGRFLIEVSGHELCIYDDVEKCIVMLEKMSTSEMTDFAVAIFAGAKIREKSHELLQEEMRADHEEELRFEASKELELPE